MGPVIELTTIYVQWQLYNTDISKEWGYTANVCKVLSWRIKLNQNDEQSQKSKASYNLYIDISMELTPHFQSISRVIVFQTKEVQP